VSQTVDQPSSSTTDQVVPGPRAPSEEAPETFAPPGPPPGPAGGDPGLIGLPSFLAGAVALGLVLVGFTPATAAGASLPLILTASSIGLTVATVWAARLGESAVAGVYAVFAGFWASYAVLSLGLTHGWLGVGAADAARTQEVYLISWLVVVGLLTVGTLRLPAAFTVLFVVVEVALTLVLIGTVTANTSITKAGGWAVFVLVALGAYLYVSALSENTGGKPFPAGRPLVR
jgi:succinate-acetate transporter protein